MRCFKNSSTPSKRGEGSLLADLPAHFNRPMISPAYLVGEHCKTAQLLLLRREEDIREGSGSVDQSEPIILISSGKGVVHKEGGGIPTINPLLHMMPNCTKGNPLLSRCISS